MPVIDSYCEVILAEDRFTVNPEPSTFPVEQFLSDLEAELHEFADQTKYTDNDMQTGRALHLILKKVFGTEKLFRGRKPSEQMRKYYDGTMEILNRQIEQDTFDSETTLTIISNLMLITSNLALWKKSKKQDRKAPKEVPLELVPISHSVVYNYLNKTFGFERKKRNAERSKKIRDFLMKPRNKKHKTWSQVVKAVVSLVLLGLGVALGGAALWGQHDIVVNRVRPEDTDIFAAIGNWVTYDLFANPLPEVKSAGFFKTAAPITSVLAILAIVAALGVWIVPPLAKWAAKKRDQVKATEDEKAMRTWCEYRYLQKVLMVTDVRLKELEG